MTAEKYKTPFIEKKPSSLRYYQEGVPEVDAEEWHLTIKCADAQDICLSMGDLLKLPQVTQHRRMVCVCNWSIKRHWRGVLLADLLAFVGISAPSSYLKQTSIGTKNLGKYESWINLPLAISRNALLAHSVDGEPLPLEQGFPLRLLHFGLYGYKNLKGLSELELTEKCELGHWERLAGYALDGTVRPKRYWAVDKRSHMYTDIPGEVTEW
jgi:DMSO/TMAO reductase YedYZ molybdopterin-dependent catalytic subunit